MDTKFEELYLEFVEDLGKYQGETNFRYFLETAYRLGKSDMLGDMYQNTMELNEENE